MTCKSIHIKDFILALLKLEIKQFFYVFFFPPQPFNANRVPVFNRKDSSPSLFSVHTRCLGLDSVYPSGHIQACIIPKRQTSPALVKKNKTAHILSPVSPSFFLAVVQSPRVYDFSHYSVQFCPLAPLRSCVLLALLCTLHQVLHTQEET